MRHHKAYSKLGRSVTHRRAVLRNLANSLVIHERIETTLTKAKALKRVADKLITLGKKNTLHARRNALSYLPEINRQDTGNAQKRTAVHKLFVDLAPRYAERNGGYTRVLRTRRRPGDNAEMAIIEFVEQDLERKTKERRKRRVRKKPTVQASDQAPSSEELKGADEGAVSEEDSTAVEESKAVEESESKKEGESAE